MSEQSVYVPVAQLVDFMMAALLKMGVPPEDAAIIADVQITADLWGCRSHGVAHLRMYHKRMKTGLQLPVTQWTVVHESAAAAVIDGGNGMGMVVGYHAMQLAIEKARRYGLGAVAARNSSHYGIAGYYPMMAVKERLAGLSVTNAHPSTAPTFGTEPCWARIPLPWPSRPMRLSPICSTPPPQSFRVARSRWPPGPINPSPKDGSLTRKAPR